MSSGRPTALVTGAASGIGRATAIHLRSDGYHVVALDRDDEKLKELASAYDVTPWRIDLAELASVEAALDEVLRSVGTPAVLVNSAGIALVASAVENDLADWQRVIDVNLTAPMLLCRSVIPPMIAIGGGVIVNVASTAAIRGTRQRAAYSSAKAGLVALTRSVATDFAGDGIRCNAVLPGTVETAYTQAVLAVAEDPGATRQFMTQRQLIGRMGAPEEIADTIAFLAGPQATFFHGSAVVVDGGRSVM